MPASHNPSARQRPLAPSRRSQSQNNSQSPADNAADPNNTTDPSFVEPLPSEPSSSESVPPPLSDIYQRITNQIAAKVQAGAGEWRMPWHSTEARGLPVNALTRKPYRGGNILPLWIAAASAGYESHEWATYKQWKEAGAQVKKGERSSSVVFWKFREQEEVPDATQ